MGFDDGMLANRPYAAELESLAYKDPVFLEKPE